MCTRISQERFIPLVADVTDESAVVALFAEIKALFGRLDLLFNNAGNNSPAKSIEEVEFTEWTRVFNANIHSTFCVRKRRLKS